MLDIVIERYAMILDYCKTIIIVNLVLFIKIKLTIFLKIKK